MSHGLPWPLMRLQREVESYRQDRGGVKGMSEMPGEEDDFEEVATTCAARRKEKTQAAACGRCQQHQGKEGCMVSARCRGECGKGGCAGLAIGGGRIKANARRRGEECLLMVEELRLFSDKGLRGA